VSKLRGLHLTSLDQGTRGGRIIEEASLNDVRTGDRPLQPGGTPPRESPHIARRTQVERASRLLSLMQIYAWYASTERKCFRNKQFLIRERSAFRSRCIHVLHRIVLSQYIKNGKEGRRFPAQPA
jgi:hypothetical protein